MYLEENLKLTPQNLSDKATASDELEEMYQQVYSENHFNILVYQSSKFFAARKKKVLNFSKFSIAPL